jgi:hypothetical protein
MSWQKSYHNLRQARRWRGMTPNMQQWILRCYRSKRGVKRSAIPARTWGALKPYLMVINDKVYFNSHGCDLLDYLRDIKKIKARKERA